MGVGLLVATAISAAASTGAAVSQQRKARKEQKRQREKTIMEEQSLKRKKKSLERLGAGTRRELTGGGSLGEEIMSTQVGRLGVIK